MTVHNRKEYVCTFGVLIRIETLELLGLLSSQAQVPGVYTGMFPAHSGREMYSAGKLTLIHLFAVLCEYKKCSSGSRGLPPLQGLKVVCLTGSGLISYVPTDRTVI